MESLQGSPHDAPPYCQGGQGESKRKANATESVQHEIHVPVCLSVCVFVTASSHERAHCFPGKTRGRGRAEGEGGEGMAVREAKE